MEVAQIRGDTVQLLYHPADEVADVGQQFALVELPTRTAGLVIQVIANESLQYAGLDQELIQRILEQHSGQVLTPLDGETGLGSIRGIKVAIAKIRKQLGPAGAWRRWGG